jgi:carbon monoxide dehydrogenase subunit G
MVLEIERLVDVDADIYDAWETLADPEGRASEISLVESYRVEGEGFVWEIALPLPTIRSKISVQSRDVKRDPPHLVHFVAESKAIESW